ncbi:MAG: hypothetical protein KGZ87_03645 [Bacteroidetes bacterium]|nr:hypothetical protein [Bacteroidota bacterium]
MGAFSNFNKSPFSSNQIFFLFSIMFFGFAPLIQFNKHIYLWGNSMIHEESFIYTNIIIIFILLFYNLLYKSILGTFKKKTFALKEKFGKVSEMKLFFVSFIASVIVLYIYRENLTLLFFRELKFNGVTVENQNLDALASPVKLIFGLFIRPIPVLLFLIFKLNCNKNSLKEFLLLLLVLITNFPLGLPRFYVAALYLPIFIIYFKSIFYKKNLLGYSILIGLLVVFPFLNQGRTVSDLSEFKISFDFEMLEEGHFDSYINFVRVIDQNIITYGKQLLGVLLFFVPRKIFPSKPIGSGGFLAEKLNLEFDHISMNYFAEGFINFGFLGIIIFILIIAYLNAKFDSVFEKIINSDGFNYHKILFLIYLGLMTFNLRGDLISCFAYTLGLFFSLYVSYFIVRKK